MMVRPIHGEERRAGFEALARPPVEQGHSVTPGWSGCDGHHAGGGEGFVRGGGDRRRAGRDAVDVDADAAHRRDGGGRQGVTGLRARMVYP